MNRAKNFLLAFTGGMVLGGIITSFTAPHVLEWYNMPGGGSALCNCVEVVTSTAESLIRAQAIGALAGGALLVAVTTVFGMRRKLTPPTAPA